MNKFKTENSIDVRYWLEELKETKSKYYHNFLEVWKSNLLTNYHMKLLIEAELQLQKYILSSQEILGSQYSQYKAKKLKKLNKNKEDNFIRSHKKEFKKKMNDDYENFSKKFDKNDLEKNSQSQENNFWNR